MHVFVIIAYKTNVEQLTMYYNNDDMSIQSAVQCMLCLTQIISRQ